MVEIKKACQMLSEFSFEFENIYGKGATTMNLHLLKHYYNMIINCGPLWAYSMFGFENNIGILKNYVCGTTDELSQIAKKYSLSEKMQENSESSQKNMFKCNDGVYQKATINIEPKYRPTLERVKAIEKGQMNLEISKRIRLNGQVISSTSAIVSKSIDYFVKTTKTDIGKICFFFGTKPSFILQVCTTGRKLRKQIGMKYAHAMKSKQNYSTLKPEALNM